MPTFLTSVIAIVIVISRFLKPYSKAKRTRAPAYSRALRRIKGGFPWGDMRSSGPISTEPGGASGAVRVGVVEMGRENDQNDHFGIRWSSNNVLIHSRPGSTAY